MSLPIIISVMFCVFLDVCVSECLIIHTQSLFYLLGLFILGSILNYLSRPSVNHASILQSFLILCFWGGSRMGGHAWVFYFYAGLSPFIICLGKVGRVRRF